MKSEKKNIDSLIESAERRSNWLKVQVKNNITEGETVKEEQYEIKWTTSTRLDIDEFERIPEADYKDRDFRLKKFINKKVVTTYAYDKSALSNFLKMKNKKGEFINNLQGIFITKSKNLKIK